MVIVETEVAYQIGRVKYFEHVGAAQLMAEKLTWIHKVSEGGAQVTRKAQMAARSFIDSSACPKTTKGEGNEKANSRSVDSLIKRGLSGLHTEST